MASDFLKSKAAQSAQKIEAQFGQGAYGSSQWLKEQAAKANTKPVTPDRGGGGRDFTPPKTIMPQRAFPNLQQQQTELAQQGYSSRITPGYVNGKTEKINKQIDILLAQRGNSSFGTIPTSRDEIIKNNALNDRIKALEAEKLDLARQVPKKVSDLQAAVEGPFSGVQDVTSGIYNAMEGVANLGDKILEGNVISKIFHDAYQENQRERAITQQNLKDAQAGRGEGFKAYQTISQGVGQALPSAALAIATGGASAVTQLPTVSTGLSATVKTALTTMAKNPQFKLSFAQNYGNSYENAKANGASENEAQLTAILTGLLNSAVEVSGGIETLPAALRTGNASAIKEWVKSSLSEGKEEVIQGVIERLTQKAVYDESKPLVSTTDPNAVFNPETSIQEGAMGTLIGGIVGGGQVGVNKAMTSILDKPVVAKNATTPQPLQAPTIAQAQSSVAMPVNQSTPTADGRQAAQNPYVYDYKPDTPSINSKIWYHGTGTSGMTADRLSPSATKIEGLLGSGIYLTDNPTVAGGYAKGRSKRTGTPTVYEASVDVDKVIDMSKPMAQDVYDVFDRALLYYENEYGYSDAYDKFKQAYADGKSGVEVYQLFSEMLSDVSQTEQIPISEFYDDFYDIAQKLKALGYDAYTHEGGKIIGKAPHQVLVLLDPNMQTGYGAKKNVTSFAPQKINTPEGMGAADAGFDPFTGLQNKYGNLPEGENAVRSDDMPAQTTPNDKVSLAARTVLGAAATPDSMVEPIEKFVVDGKASYIPITNSDTATTAEKNIRGKGFAQSYAEWVSDVKAEKMSADIIATGAMLYNQAANGGDGKLALDILDMYIDLNTRAGQSVQAAKILKTLTPDGKLYMIEKQLSNINKELNQGKKSPKEITLDPELASEFLGAKDDAAADVALDKIYKYIADQVPTNLVDMFTALRYLNMLGNLKTQVRNVLGNTGSVALKINKDRVGALLELLYNKTKRADKKIERTKSFLYNPKRFLAATKDFKNVRDAAMGEAKYSTRSKTGLAQIEDKRTIFKLNSKLGKTETSNPFAKAVRAVIDVPLQFLEIYRKATRGAMEYGDLGFSLFAYSDSLAGYLAANNVSLAQMKDGTVDQDLMDRARNYAIKEAQKATFRDKNMVSDAVAGIGFKRPDTTAKRVVNTAVQGTLPFLRTPANVGVRMWENSPLGAINTIVEGVQAAKGKEGRSASTVIDKLASTITGTGLFAIGILMFSKGVVFGGDDEDKKQQAFNELQGMQSYSILLPDGTTMTLDWATPASSPFFMGVEYAKNGLENGYTLKSVLESLGSITEPMLNLSMLSGLNNQLNSVSYSENKLVDLMLNSLIGYVSQGLTSTLGGQIERGLEPNRMTTFTDKTNPNLSTNMQYLLGKASAKVPGVDYQQQPYIDAWGRTQKNGGLLETFLSPSYTSKLNASSMEQELQRLYDSYAKENEIGVLPPASVSKTFSNDGEEISMTAEEYTQFKITKGQYAYKELTKLIASSAYKSLKTDEAKAEAVEDVWKAAAEKAKTEIMEAKGEMRIPTVNDGEKIQSYVDLGLPEQKAYTLHNDLKALKPEGDNKSVTTYQTVSTILNQKTLNNTQKTDLVASMYSKEGKTSLLPYLNASKLITLYASSKTLDLPTGDYDLINATIPAEFKDGDGNTYVLSYDEKDTYRKTYVEWFFKKVTDLSTVEQIKKQMTKAEDEAKEAIVNGRR